MSDFVRNVLIVLGAILFAGLSVVFCVIDTSTGLLRGAAYVSYALAALSLGMVIRQLVRFFRSGVFRDWLNRTAHRTRLTGRIYDDYAFRTMLAAYGSLAVNVFFALTKAAAGWYYSSVWLEALAFYYLILCLTKALVLRRGRKTLPGESGPERLQREWRSYRLCGVLLVLMTLALQGVTILIVEQGRAFSYQGTLIFVVALYDFSCLISSVVYMVRTRRKHTPIVVSLKSISFATSIVAMLTLQTAMFASYSDGVSADWKKLMNIMTGTAVCVILILWGVCMVRRANKELCLLREVSA